MDASPTIYQMLLDPSLAQKDPQTPGYFDRFVPQMTNKRKELYGEQTMHQIRKEAIIGLVADVSMIALSIFAAIWVVNSSTRSSNYQAWSDQAARALAGHDTSLFGKAPIDLTYSGSVYKFIQAPDSSSGAGSWKLLQPPSEFFTFSQHVHAKMKDITRPILVASCSVALVLPTALYALKTWVMKQVSSIQTKLDEHIATVRNKILDSPLNDRQIVQLRSMNTWKFDISYESITLRLKDLDASLTQTLYNSNLLRGKNEDITIGNAWHPDENIKERKATKLEEFKHKHHLILWDHYAGFMGANAAVPPAEDPDYPQYQNYLNEKGQLESVEKIYEEMLGIRTKISRQKADAKQLKIMAEIESLIVKIESGTGTTQEKLGAAQKAKSSIDGYLPQLETQ